MHHGFFKMGVPKVISFNLMTSNLMEKRVVDSSFLFFVSVKKDNDVIFVG